MTHLFTPGVAIDVRLRDGLPAHIVWNGQTHPVSRVTRVWRIDIFWWRGQVQRDYYKLTTASGLLAEIYYDHVRNSWFLQRVYD